MAGLLFAFVTSIFHGSAIQGGWRIDDPWILLHVTKNSNLWGHFFSPAQWHDLGVPFFTPWLLLDFQIDALLFGTSPTAFYIHQLCVLWLIALLTYLLLKPFVGTCWSIASGILFLTGAPVIIVGQQLMSRHYATGLLFLILSLLLWLKNRACGSKWYLWGASICYLAAMLNKEIYAPLPLVLFFMQQNDGLRHRLINIVPFALAAGLFVGWRVYMLDAIVGGYTGRLNVFQDWFYSMSTLPYAFWGSWQVISFAGLLFLIGAWLQSRIRLFVFLAAVIAATLPFIAIRASTAILDFRLVFLPWWAFCCLLAFASSATGRLVMQKRYRHLLVLTIILCFIGLGVAHAINVKHEYANITSSYDVQGDFIWSHDSSNAYIPGGDVALSIAFQYGLSELKERVQKHDAPIAIPSLESSYYFAPGKQIYYYDSGCRCMKALEATNNQESYNNTISRLSTKIRFDRRNGGFEWLLSELENSSCHLIFSELNVSCKVPCKGTIYYNPPPFIKGEVHVFVTTADHKLGISPVLQFPARGGLTEWDSKSI